jgi:hypothetical protein
LLRPLECASSLALEVAVNHLVSFIGITDEAHPMQINALPTYDMSVNTTGCCAKFNPQGWEAQELHLRDKPFVRAETRSLMYVPLNMGKVFARVLGNIEKAGAMDAANFIVLSRDKSAFAAEHLFAVTKPVPEEKMTTLTGEFITKVFEGPYQKVRNWRKEMTDLVRARGGEPKSIWFFYTTCPKCAKAYGQNYVVGVAELP